MGFARGFLRADFDDLLNIVGPRSQLKSCSVVHLVCHLRISASLGQWNDLWKGFSENRSVLASFACTSGITLIEASNEKVSNYKVVEDLKI